MEILAYLTRITIRVALLLLAILPAAQAQKPAAPQDATAVAIRPEAIRAHIRFLSDNLLEGRGTGTRGYELAARYVASEYEQMGLKPAGKDGGYYQPVPLRRLDVVPEACSFTILRDGQEVQLKYGVEYLMLGNESFTDASVEAPLVFAGFGVTAPEQKYDDFAGIDVKDKIVVELSGAPSTFPSTLRAHYSAGPVKTAIAAAHGAVGVITLQTPELEKRAPWPWVLRQSKMPGFRWIDTVGVPNDARPQLRGRAYMNRYGAEALFTGASKSLDIVFEEARNGKPSVFPLVGTAKVRTVSHDTAVESPNVVALLPGSDPKLKDEYVVYTAHLDHLGIGEAVKGDTIYHGALDNASGTAAMLEVARAFTALKTHPRRSVLFVSVTGEEKGLLGSDYFAHYPSVPRERIVADVNMDGTAILYPFRDVVSLGGEHSSLGPLVEREASHMHVKVTPDPAPEEVFFVRSDQYSFVKQGIPAIFLFPGTDSGDPNRTGTAILQEWMTTRYHTPQDDFSQPFDYDAAAQYAQLNFLCGYELAQSDSRPSWNPDDFFGEKFAIKKASY